MAILGIHHTAIVVSNLQEALDFYCGDLGFESVQVGPIDPAPYTEKVTQLKEPHALGHIIKSGWGYLEIWEFYNPVYPEPQDTDRPCNKPGIAHVSLMVDDCWAEYERLKDKVRFHSEPVEHSVEGDDNHAVTTYGRDPFGNIIEFWQIGPKDPQPFAPDVYPHP